MDTKIVEKVSQESVNAALLVNVLRDMEALQERITDHEATHRNFIAAHQAAMAEMHDKISSLVGAFPEGDLRGHLDTHKTMIEEEAARKASRRKLVDDLVQKGAWAVVVLIGIALWQYIKFPGAPK